jgi:membrane protein YqaA with SNARE-associated domain
MLRGLYNWTLLKAAHPRATWWLALFCFVEASFFPVPPHPLLGLMCLAEPKKAVRFAVIATLSSVAGGLLGYAIGWGLYDAVGEQLLGWLGLTESFPKAACYLNEQGFWIFVAKGATPIPFKLLTITAGFIGMSLVSRSISFMIVGILFRLFGAPIKRFIDKYLMLVTAGFIVLILAGFAAITLLSGEGDSTSDRCSQVTSIEQL